MVSTFTFTSPYFCLSISYYLSDLAAAARAAVSVDEKALDMFDWQSSDQRKFNTNHAESIQLFVGTKSGKR